MWLFYLLFYGIAFGILAAIVAKGKNRDQLNWFMIGFFLGIIGFIAALIVEKKEKATVAVQPKPTDMPRSKQLFDPSEMEKKCPDCAEKIKLEARVCRFCGYRFSDQDVADARSNWLDLVSIRSD